jgi:superfamily I DNA/RNA helicase
VEAYVKYQQLIEERALLTFDDFLVFAWQHLVDDEDVRLQWAGRWQYVLQDEYQDTNYAQVAIAELLARDHRNYMVVGDVSQAIFGFRGSKPDYLAEFSARWSGATTISMNRNYRSGSEIVRVANSVIRHGKIRAPTDMIAERGTAGTVEVVASDDFDDEGETFGNWVEQAKADGAQYGDCTALYRTNTQSRALEESLIARKIPYVVVGGRAFYERREVRDLLAYLRVATGHGDVLESVQNCINAPFRFLGKVFVDRLVGAWVPDVDPTVLVRQVADGAGIQQRQVASVVEWATIIVDLRVAASTDSPAKLLQYVVNRTRYLDWVKREEGEESVDNDHELSVQEMIRTSGRFATSDGLLDYVDATIAAAAKRRRKKENGARVQLMSIHKSKALEWPYVFVAGCNDGILPHVRGDSEEERRLMYVAMTRARDVLTLSYVRKVARSHGLVDADPSQFLIDAGFLRAS